MKLITDYVLDSSPSANVVVARRNNSSIKISRDATYSRKQPTFNPAAEVYSVPESNVVVRKDVANAEGNPSGQRLSGAVSFRIPVMTSSVDLDELLVDVRAYVNDPDLKANLLALALPTCCADE